MKIKNGRQVNKTMGVETRFPFTWTAFTDSCQSLQNPAVNYGLVADFPCPTGERPLESNESPLAEGAAVSPFRIMKSYAHAGRFQKRYTWLVIYIRLEERKKKWWNEKRIKA